MERKGFDMPDLKDSTKEACEEIDAAVFTGDEFVLSASRRQALMLYILRWTKALHEFDVLQTADILAEFNKTGKMPDPT
jgi:hypothetical protein